MKVLLHNDRNKPALPEELLRKIERKSFFERRTGETVDYFTKISIARGTSDELWDRVNNLATGEVLRWDDEHFYVGIGNGDFDKWIVSEVDTRRKWAIDILDGVEFITYLDKFTLVEKKHNYYEYQD